MESDYGEIATVVLGIFFVICIVINHIENWMLKRRGCPGSCITNLVTDIDSQTCFKINQSNCNQCNNNKVNK